MPDVHRSETFPSINKKAPLLCGAFPYAVCRLWQELLPIGGEQRAHFIGVDRYFDYPFGVRADFVRIVDKRDAVAVDADVVGDFKIGQK